MAVLSQFQCLLLFFFLILLYGNGEAYFSSIFSFSGVCIEPGDNIKCYTSDTDLNEPTDWEVFVPKNLHIAGSYVQFEVTHFSLFAVVVTKPRPKTDQKITSNGGYYFYLYVL